MGDGIHDTVSSRVHPGYVLRVEPGQLDIDRFEDLVRKADQAMARGNDAAAADHLESALLLWRGPVLAGAAAEGLQRLHVRNLEERRLAILEGWIDIELGLGRHGQMIGQLATLIEEYPLQERFYEQLMLALYRAGRQADALLAYQHARSVLAEDLGIDPGRALIEMQQAVLRADASLDIVSPRALPGPTSRSMVAHLPADVACFTGREDDAARLIAVIQEAQARGEEAIVAIHGPPGVGKSALAVHVAHELSDSFPDGQLHVDLRDSEQRFGSAAPRKIAGKILRILDQTGAAAARLPGEAPSVLRSQLSGRRILLILDNATNADHVLTLLPSSPACAVLITSRALLASVEGAWHLHLDAMDATEGIELLGRVSGRTLLHDESEAAQMVVKLCGGLPLALRIAGLRLASRTWTVTSLMERLSDSERRLDELAIDGMSVRSSFEFSCRHLRPPLRRAFELLGLLDRSEFSAALAAAALGGAEPVVEAMLERLVDNNLLRSPCPGRYEMDELIQLFARERCLRHPVDERVSLPG